MENKRIAKYCYVCHRRMAKNNWVFIKDIDNCSRVAHKQCKIKGNHWLCADPSCGQMIKPREKYSFIDWPQERRGIYHKGCHDKHTVKYGNTITDSEMEILFGIRKDENE